MSNAQLFEDFRQKIITELKDYFREELNRIENKYTKENNALREEVATSQQELNELKLKLNHERQERTQEIARLQHKHSDVGKGLHELKLQLNTQRTKTGKMKERLQNKLVLPSRIFKEEKELKTNPNMEEKNIIPFAAEASKVRIRSHTYKNTLQRKANMEATWKQSSRFDGASLGLEKRRQMEGKKRQVNNINDMGVAFFATLNIHSMNTSPNQDIIFENVVTNIGNAYHEAHGIFVAPKPGVYVFSTSILTQGQHAHVKIVKNGQMLARLDPDDWEQTSQMVVVQLKTGDDIAVKNDDIAGINFHGEQYSSFSGFLLYDYTELVPVVG